MLNELLLLSGNDIPFISAGLTIHPPTIKEIAYIGEERFFKGLELLRISLDNIEVEDKSVLETLNNFDIFMMMLRDENPMTREHSINTQMVMALLFPTYSFAIEETRVVFSQDEKEIGELNRDNFAELQTILAQVFLLKGKDGKSDDYNPANELASKIANKLKKGRAKIAEQKGQDLSKVAIYSKYISILAVGERKDMNSLLQYTVYQLMDEFQRFILKQQYDMHVKAQMAGATNLGEVTDWMKDLQSDT